MRGVPLRVYLEQGAFLLKDLDNGHYGYEGDGGKGQHPANGVGPVWEFIVAISCWLKVQPGEHQDGLRTKDFVIIFCEFSLSCKAADTRDGCMEKQEMHPLRAL